MDWMWILWLNANSENKSKEYPQQQHLYMKKSTHVCRNDVWELFEINREKTLIDHLSGTTKTLLGHLCLDTLLAVRFWLLPSLRCWGKRVEEMFKAWNGEAVWRFTFLHQNARIEISLDTIQNTVPCPSEATQNVCCRKFPSYTARDCSLLAIFPIFLESYP